ncbi:MAG: hypothetical protein SGILL_007929, partial [Bacillariaceae sp.]
TLGKVLGKGGFGTVYEVRGFHANFEKISSTKKLKMSTRNLLGNEDDVEDEEVAVESRKFISDHCLRNNGDARYAVKFLSPNVVADAATFIQGIMDMAVETRILSDTEHPNIIKMRALAKISPYNDNYFIVMDRLYDTLESKIVKWDKQAKRSKGVGKLFDRKGDKTKALLEERLVAAFDLSSALGYLHGRSIVYRDLKPESECLECIPMSALTFEIFDFGLATELKASKKTKDGLYKLTGMTGSPRYMAPEVALEQNYNEKCDVYSFALMLWQIYALKTPFELYGMKSMKSRVWGGELKRPYVDPSWPVPIKNLLKRAWSQDLQQRPGFPQVVKILRSECVRVRGGNEDGLEHSRRRSTFVFRGSKGKPLETTKGTARLSDIQQAIIEELDSDDSDGEPNPAQEQPAAIPAQ